MTDTMPTGTPSPFTLARESARLTMKQVAEASGYDYSYVAAIEAGTKKPSAKFALKYAAVVGVPPETLLRPPEAQATFVNQMLELLASDDGAQMREERRPAPQAGLRPAPASRPMLLDQTSIRTMVSEMAMREASHQKAARAVAVWSSNAAAEHYETLREWLYEEFMDVIVAAGGTATHSLRGGHAASEVLPVLLLMASARLRYMAFPDLFWPTISSDAALDQAPVDAYFTAHSGALICFGKSRSAETQPVVFVAPEARDGGGYAAWVSQLIRSDNIGFPAIRCYRENAREDFLYDLFEMEEYDGDRTLTQPLLMDHLRSIEDFDDEGPAAACLDRLGKERHVKELLLKFGRRAVRSFQRRVETTKFRHVACIDAIAEWMRESPSKSRAGSKQSLVKAARLRYCADLLDIKPNFELALVSRQRFSDILQMSATRHSSCMTHGTHVAIFESSKIHESGLDRRQLIVEHPAAAREAVENFYHHWNQLPSDAKDRKTVRDLLRQLAER